ncbi:MAG TPA: flagellar filament outer layer protein FlaA [Magnetospirillaceae bacterium]|nr:flagellar filament outer layer protein FlaA [Magnetospirillaceae bacterium]
MKKITTLTLSLSLLAFAVYAQRAVGEPDPASIGVDTARQELRLVSVDSFESIGFWRATISKDEGVIQYRLFEGGPAGKAEEPPAEVRGAGTGANVQDRYVLGIRTDFFRRGHNEIRILARRPIPIEGITKTVSVWVAGRNFNHVLKLLLLDAFNNPFQLTIGRLNFQGWKKLTVAVPPQGVDGRTGIIQRNTHFVDRSGIRIVGFAIECDPMEAFGTYYIYLDDLRAVTDLFAIGLRDPDDMADDW